MDRLYKDLTENTVKDARESVHLSDFPQADDTFINKTLERKMERAQTISSLVLSLRQREKIKVRQPLQKIMIPVLDKTTRNEIIAVSDLIKSEVNVKEIELIDEGSGILVKQIKPNFKKLGPHFGKDMKVVAQAIGGFEAEQISLLEKEGEITISVKEKNIKLTLDDVEISSQNIEGWLVANNNGITVALDVTITPDLKNEGIARELVNRIQNIRKDSGFELTDRVEVSILENETLEHAVQSNLEYIKQETLTEVFQFVSQLKNGTDITFDDITTKLNIIKHQ